MSQISHPPVDVTMPSLHSFWSLQPHPSLDFDAHRQKIVSQKNQVAVSRRHLSLYLHWKKNDSFTVADVIEVPPELFQLKDLKDILNVEVWKGCLSPSERRFLRGLLPEGADYGSLVRALARGDNFCFGNPLVDWGKQLLKGGLNPDFVQQKEVDLKQAHKEHYQKVQRYHDKMLETLRVLKEEWAPCKSVENAVGSKPRRRKSRVRDCPTANTANDCATEGIASRFERHRQKSKRRKVESFQQVSGRTNLLSAKDSQNIRHRCDKNVYNDDFSQHMRVLKVTRNQYAEVLHLMKGERDELPVSALSSVLNHQQKLEIDRANDCDDNDALRLHECWSNLAAADIPGAHTVFSQRKADKERLAKSAAEQCLQYYSVFMCKEGETELQSNSNVMSPLDPEVVPEFEKSIEADRANSSASESSVTCLEEQAGTQAPVESCLSSVDCSRDILPQRLLQEEQVSLIDLPIGSSLAGEGHATLLPVVHTEQEQQSCRDVYISNLPKRSSMNIQSAIILETDTFSECNESSIVKHSRANKNLDVQEVKNSRIDLGNWDLHSKPGSEVVSAPVTAASGESEEVDQRVIHQSGVNVCSGLDDQQFCSSGPSSLVGHEMKSEKSPLSCANYASSVRKVKEVGEQGLHHEENHHKVTAAPPTEVFSQSKDVHPKEYQHVFELDQNQVDSEQNNQMMLHLFLDQKSHSSEFLAGETSSSQELQGKNSFCGQNSAIPLVSRHDGEDILNEHEPITELSLLIDDRSAKESFLAEQADSVSSRTGAEFGLHESLEPHWMLGHNKPDPQVYPFHQSSRELHFAQSNQDTYSPHSFMPMLPVLSNPQQMSHLGFTNHWNVDEGADQTNWVSAEAAGTPLFSLSKEAGGRSSSGLQYWDQVSRGPYINNWATKQDQSLHQSASFLRRGAPDLQDEQTFQAQDNWGPIHPQQSTQLPYHVWGTDRSGRVAPQSWKNGSLFSHIPPQYEQQKVQNAYLSKMNPNFTASWH